MKLIGFGFICVSVYMDVYVHSTIGKPANVGLSCPLRVQETFQLVLLDVKICWYFAFSRQS